MTSYEKTQQILRDNVFLYKALEQFKKDYIICEILSIEKLDAQSCTCPIEFKFEFYDHDKDYIAETKFIYNLEDEVTS